ncbi:EAL domain-containing protein [Roseomonas sp. KE2513]|uniref:putative bifunctional diguanylate cyclase/phosphodiesterase n=1 Tax=Roseomonas sp. KE2513 TaxID=2479202 RepID=UPI0018DF06A2|nr:EAL domain-containing protein [Roseomonas sp. KE2513]MBI0539360.1 EAL domain-containing protein [Roseomonas sp. KE2513]
MPPAPLPHDEAERLIALHGLDLIDTPASEVFNSFVRVASGIFSTTIAAISLIDTDRQWFKASVGLPIRQTPRDVSFCAHAILQPHEVLCVSDARLDPRFTDHPDVLSGDLRFYAGVPLLSEEGHALGALCVADRHPQQPDKRQLEHLRDLATGVSAAIRLHSLMHRLEKEAHRDPLTSLSNRREFEALLSPAANDSVTLFLLDLDNFKGINDVFGHPGGDLVLQEVGRRLQALVRSGDRAFRLGGDEFALLCPGMASSEARQALADRIHAAIGAAFMVDDQPVPLRTSIGIATLPDDAKTAQELVQAADAALYRAKRAGRGVTRQAATLPDTIDPLVPKGISAVHNIGRMDLAARLRQALVPSGAEPFHLVFQPVMALNTQETTSLEALVRWDISPGSAVPPDEFVTLAERLGLISHLDRWVLNAACKEAATWPKPWRVAVNISALSFGLMDVAAMVEDALTSSGLASDRLIIEMTETALGGDTTQVQKAVQGIRELGARIVLDDFGGGHGSLMTLRQFPFTGLKIDQSLVKPIASDTVHARMVEVLAEFGHVLDIRVVAEGVESMEQLRILAECGVPLAQGYLFAKPVRPSDLVQAIEAAEVNLRAALAASQLGPFSEAA